MNTFNSIHEVLQSDAVEKLAAQCIQGVEENNNINDGSWNDWEDAHHIAGTYLYFGEEGEHKILSGGDDYDDLIDIIQEHMNGMINFSEHFVNGGDQVFSFNDKNIWTNDLDDDEILEKARDILSEFRETEDYINEYVKQCSELIIKYARTFKVRVDFTGKAKKDFIEWYKDQVDFEFCEDAVIHDAYRRVTSRGTDSYEVPSHDSKYGIPVTYDFEESDFEFEERNPEDFL